MIISHKYKYLFIEIPHTASTAISRELCKNYDGIPMLRKHAHYYDFQKVANIEEKTYFVFAGIRNPLDEAVSIYYKFKNNHKKNYTNPKRLAKHGGHVSNAEIRRFKFIQNTGADFPTYFKKYYRLPYNNINRMSFKHCDFIIRFENLQEDFSKALELIGIKQKRPLPQVNKTSDKKADFLSYYSPEIVEQAKRVFGPFMKEWGYDFPPEWGDGSVSRLDQLEFQLVNLVRDFFWKYVRRSHHFYGRLFRRLR
jgi:hypothetical protein